MGAPKAKHDQVTLFIKKNLGWIYSEYHAKLLEYHSGPDGKSPVTKEDFAELMAMARPTLASFVKSEKTADRVIAAVLAKAAQEMP